MTPLYSPDYDDDWGSDSVLNQVLAESQQEYFNSLKRQAGQSDNQQVRYNKSLGESNVLCLSEAPEHDQFINY